MCGRCSLLLRINITLPHSFALGRNTNAGKERRQKIVGGGTACKDMLFLSLNFLFSKMPLLDFSRLDLSRAHLFKLASEFYSAWLRFLLTILSCGDSTSVFCFNTQYTKPGCHFARVQCISGHSCLPPCCWHVFPIYNTSVLWCISGQGMPNFFSWQVAIPTCISLHFSPSPRPSQARQVYFFRL